MLAVICFRTFTKPDFAKGKYNILGLGKKRRNSLYMTCGVVILACIALVLFFNFMLKDTTILQIPPLFLFEFIALVAFGIAWLAKGKVYPYPKFFRDRA